MIKEQDGNFGFVLATKCEALSICEQNEIGKIEMRVMETFPFSEDSCAALSLSAVSSNIPNALPSFSEILLCISDQLTRPSILQPKNLLLLVNYVVMCCMNCVVPIYKN